MDICDIKNIKVCETIKEGFGDPKIHKDKYGDYYLILPYTSFVKPNLTKKPTLAIDCGIKTFVNGYDTLGNTYKHVNLDDKLLPLLRKEDHLKSLDNTTRKIETQMINVRKRIHNMINDMHFKVINNILKDHNLIIYGKFNPSQILKSSTITKYAKRKLSALAHYRFKQQLIFKANTNNVSVIQ